MAANMIDQFRLSTVLGFSREAAAVVACDAGASAHIAAWLAPCPSLGKYCLDGPAVGIFEAAFEASIDRRYSLSQVICGSELVITGTGWSSDLEHRARVFAKELGIPSVAVLDHWCNYRDRFRRDGEEQLPDAFWVADRESFAIATVTFPNIPVLQLPNYWLDALRSKVEALRRIHNRQPRRPARRLLYLLEPIRVPWSQGPSAASEAGEIQGLRYWLQQLPHLIEQGWVAPQCELEALALRPHPSEPVGKYDALIAEATSSWPIQLDRAPALAEALAWADAAFGCETQALVTAMACNLPAFSTVPPWAPPCRLPQAELHHLSQLDNAPLKRFESSYHVELKKEAPYDP
jgi:hypothetical protein